jgi:hypothetical protein
MIILVFCWSVGAISPCSLSIWLGDRRHGKYAQNRIIELNCLKQNYSLVTPTAKPKLGKDDVILEESKLRFYNIEHAAVNHESATSG